MKTVANTGYNVYTPNVARRVAQPLWLMLKKHRNLMTKTHWKRHDFRVESLTLTITGLEKSILELNKKHKEVDWYDGLWLLEESEPIIGLAFIALQNYINSSIYDRFETLDKQYEKYKSGTLIESFNRTDIELIVGIANYFKHRDDHKDLRPNTANILSDCDLQFDKEVDITNSPIFKGLEYYTKTWNLTELMKYVTDWREKLWLEK